MTHPRRDQLHSRSVLRRIDPPSSGLALDYLRYLEEHLRECQPLLDRLDARHGVRPILGHRYEVFVATRGRSSTGFRRIVKQMLAKYPIGNAKDTKTRQRVQHYCKEILDYCRAQVRRADLHLVLDNFSLLINYGPCRQQAPHLDLVAAQGDLRPWQFGMALGKGAAPTLVYRARAPQRAADLIELGWSDLPASVAEALDGECGDLLRNYGALLDTNVQREAPPAPLVTGTVLALAGGVIHAGPASSDFRAWFFFAGHAQGEPAYNPEHQYFAATLWACLVERIWPRLRVDDRRYVLQKLVSLVGAAHEWVPEVHAHMADGPWHDFVRDVQAKQCRHVEAEIEAMLEWNAPA